MKANELMIGDLVKLMNPKGEWLTNVRINKDLFIPFLHDEENGFVRFEPIPLTAEILEKNGWSRNSIFMELYADENTQFSWANRCGAVLFKNGWCHCDCKYVHTLQHAFRLCGFDKLADNFKNLTL